MFLLLTLEFRFLVTNMAIVFLQQRKVHKNLIIVFALVFIILLFVIWQGFFKKEIPSSQEFLYFPHPEVEINFDVLKSPFLEGLQPFSEIGPLKEPLEGRPNPFLSY